MRSPNTEIEQLPKTEYFQRLNRLFDREVKQVEVYRVFQADAKKRFYQWTRYRETLEDDWQEFGTEFNYPPEGSLLDLRDYRTSREEDGEGGFFVQLERWEEDED